MSKLIGIILFVLAIVFILESESLYSFEEFIQDLQTFLEIFKSNP